MGKTKLYCDSEENGKMEWVIPTVVGVGKEEKRGFNQTLLILYTVFHNNKVLKLIK